MNAHFRDFETHTDLREKRGTTADEELPRSDGDKPLRADPVEDAPAGEKADRASEPTRRRWLRPALFALVPVALLGGLYVYATGGRYLSTDDAYVNARDVGISTDVSGIVADVDVWNNEYVTKGRILYRLDPRQFQIAVDNAMGNLGQIALTLRSMKSDYRQMLAEAAAEQAQVVLDQHNYARYAALLGAQAIAKMTVDQAEFTLAADQSKLNALNEQAASELVKIDGNPDTPVEQMPQYLEAKAQLREAERQLNDSVVRAPYSGTITDVPATTPGKYLAASTVAFYLVDTDHLWVDATPKETELTHVRPGQPASITVDTYPGVTWHGVVESISPAAAQQFSLLPAENTSGNWVKVVQRLPVRVHVDPNYDNAPLLRAGMSVEVRIDTGHARGLHVFF
ncbi:MAG TPA: HlyD family secretion protein [Rhizomicrobium sp.]|jgi:membrane fusion protein (multidrug efflux system)|nr:HlyD family secretion protein [Rhizomicrobium sp.]